MKIKCKKCNMVYKIEGHPVINHNKIIYCDCGNEVKYPNDMIIGGCVDK
jgi:hypothetical protein